MGKSFNDRNRKKGDERAYRRTKRKSSKPGNKDRAGWNEGFGENRPESTPRKEWTPDSADWY